MVTFPHSAVARNSSDVPIKYVHSEKRSDVNRLTVAVLKFSVFDVGIVSNCVPFYRFYISFFIVIDMHLSSAVNCKNPFAKLTVYTFHQRCLSRPMDEPHHEASLALGRFRPCISKKYLSDDRNVMNVIIYSFREFSRLNQVAYGHVSII